GRGQAGAQEARRQGGDDGGGEHDRRGAAAPDRGDGRMSRERLIVALDHASAKAALAQVDDLGDAVERYKVGLELFVAEGRPLIDELHERDKRVFLDLKLHDIPETVRRAAEVASQMGVELLTVHAGGGRKMLEAAVAGAGATR